MPMKTATREDRDLGMMRDLNGWPRWPWLPLKRNRNKGDGDFPELACMHADYVLDCRPRVYFVYLMSVGWFPAPDAKYQEYESFDAVVADGWRID